MLFLGVRVRKEHKGNCPHVLCGVDSINVSRVPNFLGFTYLSHTFKKVLSHTLAHIDTFITHFQFRLFLTKRKHFSADKVVFFNGMTVLNLVSFCNPVVFLLPV